MPTTDDTHDVTPDEFRELCERAYGSVRQASIGLGYSPSHLSRILRDSEPGELRPAHVQAVRWKLQEDGDE